MKFILWGFLLVLSYELIRYFYFEFQAMYKYLFLDKKTNKFTVFIFKIISVASAIAFIVFMFFALDLIYNKFS